MKALSRMFLLASAMLAVASCGDSSTSPMHHEDPVPGDDFSDISSMGHFLANSAPWTVQAGAMSCRGATGQSYLIRDNVRFRNGWVEVEVDSVDDGGIAARVQDTQNLILLALHDNSGPFASRLQSRVQLWIVKNGRYRQIDSSAFDWPRGTKATARLHVVADTIEAWMNGVRVCRKVDTTIRDSGAIALRHLGTESDPNFTRPTMISHYLSLHWSPQ
ncbi:MAG: hypothetical protein H6686_07915 [Fibrobacteria bacterium]|nr:hypothetical protein [Fibrobacteria bacterium]